jgi:DeoR family transcriptional regulator of aga operon
MVDIAVELTVRPEIKVVVTGGVCRPQSYELVGPFNTEVLEQLSLDTAFLGVDALDAEMGASAHHEGEAAVNRLMASRARYVAIVADGSKLGRRSFSRICRPEQIDRLITDASASDAAVQALEDAGIRVTTV